MDSLLELSDQALLVVEGVFVVLNLLLENCSVLEQAFDVMVVSTGRSVSTGRRAVVGQRPLLALEQALLSDLRVP